MFQPHNPQHKQPRRKNNMAKREQTPRELTLLNCCVCEARNYVFRSERENIRIGTEILMVACPTIVGTKYELPFCEAVIALAHRYEAREPALQEHYMSHATRGLNSLNQELRKEGLGWKEQ